MVVLYSGGEAGSIGLASEWDPIADTGTLGTFVTPTQFLMAESDSLDDKPNMIARNVFAGPGRDSDVGYRTGTAVVGGSIGMAEYPKNGALFITKALGKNVSIGALSADTTTSIVITNGSAAIALTAGGAYNAGDIVFIGTAGTPAYEPLVVMAYNSGTKTLTTNAPANTHTSSGTAIHRQAFTQDQPITASDAVGDVLGSVSIQEMVGDKYGQLFPGMFVNKRSLKVTTAKADVTVDLVSMSRRQLANGVGSNPSPTAFSQSGSWGELAFEFAPDSYVVFPADPTDSGTSTAQVVGDVTDWGIDILNNFKAEATANRSAAMRQFPKAREVDVNFSMINPASRPVVWTDFLTQNLDASWFGVMAMNIGTPAVPVWVVRVYYCPNIRVQTAVEVKGLTDTIGETVTAKARGVNGQPKLLVSTYAA